MKISIVHNNEFDENTEWFGCMGTICLLDNRLLGI